MLHEVIVADPFHTYENGRFETVMMWSQSRVALKNSFIKPNLVCI